MAFGDNPIGYVRLSQDHDFKNFPELTTSQMDLFYFQSPHKQIMEDFSCKVVRVVDGDTMTLRWNERDFDFPLRLLGIDAPELDQRGGLESFQWMREKAEGKDADIIIDTNQRVGKFGRLLGNIIVDGINLNELSIIEGHSVPFDRRAENVPLASII